LQKSRSIINNYPKTQLHLIWCRFDLALSSFMMEENERPLTEVQWGRSQWIGYVVLLH